MSRRLTEEERLFRPMLNSRAGVLRSHRTWHSLEAFRSWCIREGQGDPFADLKEGDLDVEKAHEFVHDLLRSYGIEPHSDEVHLGHIVEER